ncbi:MAG: S16 family serine protease [Candidatus Aenigmatarchaeota archaeon]
MHKYRKDAVKKKKPRNKAGTCAIIFSAAAIFMTGYLVGVMNYMPYTSLNESHNASASILIPAVDDDGFGMLAKLTVQTSEGDGRVLANIDKMLFWTDTQNSIRVSSKVASNITGMNLSKYDIIYNIETESTSVEGPSAGAALAIVTVASLTGKEIDARIVITGTINEDGTIGHVSHVLAKAKAAKEAGMSTFLVPSGQSTEIIYDTRKYCDQAGPAPVCTTDNVPVSVDIAKETGIEIKEVKSIEEALVYFFGGDNA